MTEIEVFAAGVVPVRPGNGGQVAVIHRPRYDDWSFPKGKREGDESDEETALRELREETGLIGRLGEELPTARYTDHRGRAKQVRYWVAEIDSDDGFRPGEEVDQLRWVSPAEALRLLTYPHDRLLVRDLTFRRATGP